MDLRSRCCRPREHDLNGNRASDTFLGNRVLVSGGGAPIIAGYDDGGQAIYAS